MRIAGARYDGRLLPNGRQELVRTHRSPIRPEANPFYLAGRRREANTVPATAFATQCLAVRCQVDLSLRPQPCNSLDQRCSIGLVSTSIVAGTSTGDWGVFCCPDHHLTQVRSSHGINQIGAAVAACLMSAPHSDGLMVTSTNKKSFPGDVGMAPLDLTHRFIIIRVRKQSEQYGNTTKTWPGRR